MTALRSSLAPHAPVMRDVLPERGRIAAQRAWVEDGIALIRPEWLRGQGRDLLIALADKVHGKRMAGSV